MKNKDLSVYSPFLAGLSFFLLTMFLFTGTGYPIFIIVLSIIVIYSGYLNFKNNEKKLAVFIILIGLFCLYEASVYFYLNLRNESFKSKPSYSGIRFLGNSNTVALLYSDSPQDIYVKYTYDVLDKKFTRQTKRSLNYNYNYSRDGKKIVFFDNDDIFMMNADGSNMKKLTNHYNRKKDTSEKLIDGVRIIRESNKFPSFSSDGKHIIFVREIFRHKETKSMTYGNPDCDIYEIDVDTGNERRLTNYKIDGKISYARYFSDGKRLIFGAHGHSAIINPGNDYFSGIFIIDDKNSTLSTLNPKKIHQYCHYPSISFNDKIAFICSDSSFHKVENVFIENNDAVKRLTNLKDKIVSVEISSDGKFIVFKEHRTDQFDKHFWVMESDGKNLTEIIPPKE